MKRLLTGAATIALAVLVTAQSASAQGIRFGLGGTALVNLGSGSYTALGGIGMVGFGGRADRPLSFRVDGTVVNGSGATVELVSADAVYAPHTPTSALHPYGLLGAGFQHAPGTTDPLVKGGVGFDYHLFKRNHGTVLFGEGTLDLVFRGSGAGTGKSLQLNLGLKFGQS